MAFLRWLATNVLHTDELRDATNEIADRIAAALVSPRVEPATSDDAPAECDLAEGETFTNEDAAALGLHVQNWWKHRAAPRVETEGDAARGVVVVGEDDPRGLLVTIRFPDKANVTIGQHVTARFAPYVAVDPKEGP